MTEKVYSKSDILKKILKNGYFQIIASAVSFHVFHRNLTHLFNGPFCYQEKIRKDLFEYFWRYCNPKFEKWRQGKLAD